MARQAYIANPETQPKIAQLLAAVADGSIHKQSLLEMCLHFMQESLVQHMCESTEINAILDGTHVFPDSEGDADWGDEDNSDDWDCDEFDESETE